MRPKPSKYGLANLNPRLNKSTRKLLDRITPRISERGPASWYLFNAIEGMPRAFSALGFVIDTHPKYRDLKSAKEHVKCYKIAAHLGDRHACYNIGQCYWIGCGVKKSNRLAVYWWRKAAVGGYEKAITCLASSYYNAEGVQRSRNRALILYGIASVRGDKVATRELDRLSWADCTPLKSKG